MPVAQVAPALVVPHAYQGLGPRAGDPARRPAGPGTVAVAHHQGIGDDVADLAVIAPAGPSWRCQGPQCPPPGVEVRGIVRGDVVEILCWPRLGW